MSVHIVNATSFFKRQTYLYAFGDIKLKKPIALNKMLYIIIFGCCWTLPLILIFGVSLNIWYLAFILLPPMVLGSLATKPIFGGKNLFDFANTMIEFSSEPKGWTDGENNSMSEESYEIASEVWISRRRELQTLADIIEGSAYIVDDNEESPQENKLNG